MADLDVNKLSAKLDALSAKVNCLENFAFGSSSAVIFAVVGSLLIINMPKLEPFCLPLQIPPHGGICPDDQLVIKPRASSGQTQDAYIKSIFIYISLFSAIAIAAATVLCGLFNKYYHRNKPTLLAQPEEVNPSDEYCLSALEKNLDPNETLLPVADRRHGSQEMDY